MNIGLVVEGLGDRLTFPSMVAKTAQVFEEHVFVSNVVEGGGWTRLRKPGQLERFCKLASVKNGVQKVIVVVDLDDDCAMEESESCSARIGDLENELGIPVSVCFCIREFECWLLDGLQSIKNNSSDVTWRDHNDGRNPCEIRDAKGAFAQHLGSNYRESIDQVKFAKRIDLRELILVNRSYRKFGKCVTGLEYEDWPEYLQPR